jgi:HK97 family phage portal protein
MAYRLDATIPFIHKMNGEKRSAKLQGLKRLWDEWIGEGVNSAGVKVNGSTALKHSAYWRAVNLLSSQIASFPIGLFKRLPNGDTEEIFNHAAVKLLTRRPNNITTSFIWKESTQANVLTRGNAYSYIVRNSMGVPVELRMMDSKSMQPKTDGESLVYEYIDKVFDPYYILHIPGLSFDGIKGLAVLEAAAESIGSGLAMQKYTNNFFKNGAMQTGVLSHPLQLSEKARGGLRTSFDKNIKDKQGGTMILDEGMKYQTLSIPPDQQQLLQSKQFGVQEIARWFGVPVHLLMEESRSTFNNIAEQGISFVRYTLTQWVERWEAELESKLLTEEEKDDHFFKFNMNSLMRGNPTDRGNFISQMIQNGVMSINEGRRLEDLNSIEGGDEHYVQVNMQPINKKSDGTEGNKVSPGTGEGVPG